MTLFRGFYPRASFPFEAVFKGLAELSCQSAVKREKSGRFWPFLPPPAVKLLYRGQVFPRNLVRWNGLKF